MKKKTLSISELISIVLGLLFLAIAFVYFRTPADSLPNYMPGFQTGSTVIHLKHGLASLVLALAFFAYAWFKSGKRK